MAINYIPTKGITVTQAGPVTVTQSGPVTVTPSGTITVTQSGPVTVTPSGTVTVTPDSIVPVEQEVDACTSTPVIITISDANSTQSAALPVGKYYIRSNLDIAFAVGANPTATSADRKLFAYEPPFSIQITTTNHKVAAIRTIATTGSITLWKYADL